MTTNHPPTSTISRRTLAKGAAWAAPAVTVAASTPAFAASPPAGTGIVCGIDRGLDPSSYNNILMTVYFGWLGTPNTTLPTGTSITYSITIDQTRSSVALPGAPSVSYGSYFEGSAPTVTPSTTYSSGTASSYTYTWTIKSTQPIPLDANGQACGPYLVWNGDNSVRPSYVLPSLNPPLAEHHNVHRDFRQLRSEVGRRRHLWRNQR